MPYSMTSEYVRHNPNKIDPDLLQIDFIFIYIEHDGSLHGSTFRYRECIEWMPIVLILTILHFYEYGDFSFLHNYINLSSLYLIVTLDDLVSFAF